MKNCDSCSAFHKCRKWRDGRKGICDNKDVSIKSMKGKHCKYYTPKKYNRGKND